MSFDTLAIKKMYRTKQENIVDLFLAPALKESVLYDCGSGYFTLNSLSELAEGLIPFIRHGGQMRVVTSVELNEKDVKVLEAGLKIQSETIMSKLQEKVAAQLDDPEAILNLDVILSPDEWQFLWRGMGCGQQVCVCSIAGRLDYERLDQRRPHDDCLLQRRHKAGHLQDRTHRYPGE